MITLIGGHLQTPAGVAVQNGSASFQLNVDATVIAAPFGIVLAEEVVVFQLDASGSLRTGAQLYSNAELQPQNSNGLGTYYLVTIYDQNGARINKNPMWWQFPEAANSTIDISDMTPYSTVGGNIIFYPVPAGGGGSVTSVAFTGDGIVTTATPSVAVTSTGNVAATALTQNANTVLAGPTSGPAASPTFRTLVSGDFPTAIASVFGRTGVVVGASGDYTDIQISPTQLVTSFSATPGFNAATSPHFKITLTGNVTSSSLTGAVAGQVLVFEIVEGGSGGYTFAWPPNALGGMSIQTTLGTVNIQAFYYDGTNAYALSPGAWY